MMEMNTKLAANALLGVLAFATVPFLAIDGMARNVPAHDQRLVEADPSSSDFGPNRFGRVM